MWWTFNYDKIKGFESVLMMSFIVIYLEDMTNVKCDSIFYKIIQSKIIFNGFIVIDTVVIY